ncbi:o-succinylbenzoate--CoA ligase [Chlorobium phaeovibrioides]|uniref:O-succinylbenzoate--CoA ligase n=1 Tax=Chlorobium phaeovibrioides TaxID=1094 RepID=A0ABW9UNI6_CHLPH|nr:o-succinylbenzoate--CoA ligase [Chlorobium phaeovibrioides]MWV54613.1 o-succinylbenzoate--CoA ligase [Chlorobium phaeovibrioides]QEQ57422.1 o-succinylbenzoate--CoA ligase [Chlorobium phaeovibrioides]
MDPVTAAAERFGTAPALITPETALSFQECDTLAGSIAAHLQQKGAVEGAIVAILSPNTVELILCLYALLKAGMVAAPLNHRLPETTLSRMKEALRPDITLNTEECASLVSAARANPAKMMPSCNGTLSPATIIHTSASTGTAKAVVHTTGSHLANARGANGNIPFGPGCLWLLSLPLFHIGGCAILYRSLISGGAVAIDSAGTAIQHSLTRFPLTHLSLVPTQLYRLLSMEETAVPLQRLKAILLGGAPATACLIENAASRHLPVYLSYGSTEMSSQIATTPSPLTAPGVPPLSLLSGREAATAPDGELLVRGSCLFSGYFHNGALLPATDSEGWFHTGDIGTIDNEGRLELMGRKDSMFISGGENIHPEEIERALLQVDGILEALVVPVPDSEYGERPAAFIRSSAPGEPDEKSIREQVRQQVGRLKTPVLFYRVCQWATLPGSDKTDRIWYQRVAREYRTGEVSDGLSA